MMDKPKQRKKSKAEYRVRTHLIHGNYESKKWDYSHHVIPPMSSSATYRLSSAHRGAQGFVEFASESMDFVKHVPIYIYERLEEPTRGMLEENVAYGPLLLYRKDFGGVLSPRSAWSILVHGLPTLSTRMINQQKTAFKVARFLEEHPVARVVYPGLESHPQFELAKHQMVNYENKLSPGSMIYFVLKDGYLDAGAVGRAEKLIDYIAEHSYCITLAVSLGQMRTLIESPYCMTHYALPEEERRKRGLEPGGIRLSIGLEDWHDLMEDLNEALHHI